MVSWHKINYSNLITIYSNVGDLERYNIFTAIMLVRNDEDGKMQKIKL